MGGLFEGWAVQTLGDPSLAWAQTALAVLVGLAVGSFLNVVVYRLPRMLERRWAQECAAFAADGIGSRSPAEVEAIDKTVGAAAAVTQAEAGADAHAATSPVDAGAEAPPYNLMRPGSSCPSCGHAIRWQHNVPVLGWLWLRGRCADCQARISPRYPLVELATGALFGLVAWRWGLTGPGLAWAAFGATLLALALIDWDTTLLPDDLTLPLVWGGLLASAQGWTGTDLPTALWGAVGGYLFLWTVYQAFRLFTGKEGMGYGDFKLLAALGAWFGWPALIPLVLISSLLGAVAGGLMKVTIGLVEGKYVQYGPWLAAAGFVAMAAGPDRLGRAMGLG
jgi:leader peptidase (prepilin peptidase)/N-methyltransferase